MWHLLLWNARTRDETTFAGMGFFPHIYTDVHIFRVEKYDKSSHLHLYSAFKKIVSKQLYSDNRILN